MKLVVGLGNPGLRYSLTRHNIGFWLVDELSKQMSIPVNKEKWQGIVGEGRGCDSDKVILLKPSTYMNLSGESVKCAIDYLKLDAEDILVVYDDMDLDPGKIRLRLKGGAGGHNGIKSIISSLGTENFKRLRIGIGRPTIMSITDHVLSKFKEDEIDKINKAINDGSQAVSCWLKENFLIAMNDFN